MESASPQVPFPLLKNPNTYSPCTIPYRAEHDSPHTVTETEKIWLDVFRRSVPSFRTRASQDDSVSDPEVRAQKFEERYLSMLDAIERDPTSHGGYHDCISLCRLRDVCLRELGFRDIFKKVKEEENTKALLHLPAVLITIDGIADEGERLEHLVKGVFAGNIFDLGATKSAEMFSHGEMTFDATYKALPPRPWLVDDFDRFKEGWHSGAWKKVVMFCDNAGADIVLGMLPFAREFVRRGAQVILAVNEVPSINDITYTELLDVIQKLEELREDRDLSTGVDSGRLMVVSSGSDLPVVDLATVSPELAFAAEDADLIVLEGMGRGIETNLNVHFKVDCLNIGMIKHQEVATFLGGRLYDCVIRFKEATTPISPTGKRKVREPEGLTLAH